MSECGKNPDDHCCWMGKRGVCPFLTRSTVPGFYWACELRRDLGSWDAVHQDSRYIEEVKAYWLSIGLEEDCGDYPAPGKKCHTCGHGVVKRGNDHPLSQR
jgi:hypothetical protein